MVKKVALTEDMLENAVEEIRMAVTEAYPEGLPEIDPVRQALEGTEELAGTSVSSSYCP